MTSKRPLILPKKLFDDINKYKIEYRQEKRQDKLFDRYAELQWFDEDRKEEVGCGDDAKERDRFINYCVEVYIND